MISLRELAKICQVSQSTVSRALKGDKRISDQVIQRVAAEAKKHRYRPSRVVQGIFTGRTNAVALIASDTSFDLISQQCKVIQQSLLEHGLSTFIYNTSNDPAVESACFHEAVSHRVSGVIIHPTNYYPNEEYFQELLAHQIPFVLLGTFGSDLGFPFVHNDDSTLGIEVVRHLAGLGHRVIAHVAGSADWLKGSNRFKGYKTGLTQVGLKYDASLVKSFGWTADDACNATRELLAERPDVTAIFAANDILAVGVLRALREYGLKIPDDVSLVGAGDASYSDILDPPLTTVQMNTAEHGRAAAALLLKLIKGKPGEGLPRSKREVVISTELIVRQSTGRCREKGLKLARRLR